MLRKRPLDALIVIFFAFNFLFVTYLIDLEQLTIADPARFDYPLWPPRAVVDLVHWWGRTYDPALLAREAWWRATIWIDVLAFGPFYACAVYAFWKGRKWIRMPSILWAAVMLTNVTVILFEELKGAHATPRPGIVILANASWIVLPVIVLARMIPREDPFA